MADCGPATEPCSHTQQSSTVHWLPCAIKFDGDAQVAQYFQPETKDNGLQATFRGRLLKGRELPLPEGYRGHVVSPQPAGATPAAAAAAGSSTFSTITYWNHDLQPSKVDTNSRALEWLHLSTQMHAPVSQEAIEQQLEAIMSKGYKP